ncbi:type I restriction endonuclease subunit S [Lactobacillus taiwanensis]|uniref:restriction endonuclease subunit S n=1 Tax=Lactobacillus taiwanensis TaxID=508451 RepID=UPI000B9848C3|nr:restriction endonuclease subunit S [Lactobacillus taiwanensis]OYS21705.1 type I restriction endonuclease subunit S [Lactobacillus taiwanensis]OYS25754.1 type I restriction endonuclease subunit S [Lactobacillus taiwanensis]OYS27912.1 type I restriction endonuclease subunit S [Lactobacillus taiwanensis]OYS36580.1 type I restriction endonuclease subunit S [Lactobacillus taiwanensis]
MSKSYIKLGELASYINGYAFKPKDRGSEGLPIIRIQDLTGSSNDKGFYKGTYPSKIEINNGDVLISWSASLGVYVWNNGKALLNQHIFKVVFDKGEIDKDYFVYAVQFSLHRMRQLTHGATMKHVVKKDFENVLIPYPSLKDQRKVAHVLDKLKESINKKMDELTKLDELIKARFVEMFGDPNISEKNQKKVSMTDVCQIIDGDRGKNYPHANDFCNDGYCLFLNAKNVTTSGFDFSNKMYISKEKDEALKKGKLNRGDLVLTTRGTIGNLAFYSSNIPFDNIRINSGMVILRLNHDKIEERFFIEHFKLQLLRIKQKVASGTAQPQLPISTMNKIKIFLPPLSLQNEFANFVQQVDKSKVAVQKSLDETQKLFDSLMQEYFG